LSEERNFQFQGPRILIKGAGEMASGVALRLFRSGYRILFTELERPLSIRRTVSFSECVDRGRWVVEGVHSVRIEKVEEASKIWNSGGIPLVVDPEGNAFQSFRPHVLVDAVLAKRNTGTRIDQADLVIGLGPGFEAGVDVHYVVETDRGHDLGRVLDRGSARPRTGRPAIIGGLGEERVLRAPVTGIFQGNRRIGEEIQRGDRVGQVSSHVVKARCSGLLRGLVRDGLPVFQGRKVGDIDPRGSSVDWNRVSDKALAISGGVLEAILRRFCGVDRVD
jgi:xanthine dehydrogenase accessory factor